jgi:hypothetical protein
VISFNRETPIKKIKGKKIAPLIKTIGEYKNHLGKKIIEKKPKSIK